MPNTLLFCVVCFAIWSCQTPTTKNALPEPCDRTVEDTADLVNEFGKKLFVNQVTATTTKNLVIAPLGVQYLLGVLANGAAGKTREEYIKASGAASLNELNKTLNAVQKSTEDCIISGVQLDSATSVWLSESYTPLPAFVSQVASDFNASVDNVDFASSEGLNQINQWVVEKSHGKLTAEGIVRPENVALYLHVIYFAGEWAVPFEPSSTKVDKFEVAPGKFSEIPVMMQAGTIDYAKSVSLEVVRLPFGKDKAAAMYFFLPSTDASVAQVIAEAVHHEQFNFRQTNVELRLPKFKIKTDIGLMEFLKSAGVSFVDADLSNMSTPSLPSPNYIRQRALLEVDEKGAVAVAITYAGTTSASGITFVSLLRPFIFLIRDEQTQANLFWGVVANPEAL